MKSTLYQISGAVDRWNNGDFATLAEIERETGVKRQTLQKRLAGSQPYADAHAHEQKMPPAMEEMLVQWLITEDRCGRAANYSRTRSMAMEIMQFGGIQEELGELWHRNFIRRHPPISTIYARKIDLNCISDCNIDAINSFFEQYEAIIQHWQIEPENTWNMDESGQQLTETGREKVVAEANS
jgi:hypothetical protein